MTKLRIYFAGVGTTALLIGAGFGGGVMLAKTAVGPIAPAVSHAAADNLPPPARIILPAPAEAATAAQPPVPAAPAAEPSPQLIQANEVTQPLQQDKAAERAERRKAEAEERDHRRRSAERKARREAARIARQQQQQQEPHQQPGILAFGPDDERPRTGDGWFNN